MIIPDQPKEIETINKFKCEFPFFIDLLIKDRPYNIHLKIFKKLYVNQISVLEFACNPCDDNDEFFDATIYCNTHRGMIGHPVSINITKLTKQIDKKVEIQYCTETLVDLVHPDKIKNFIPQLKSKKDTPSILLIGKGFGTQLIDGSHRVLHSYYNGHVTTPVIKVTLKDMLNCLESDSFYNIIRIFYKLINILSKDNPNDLFKSHPLFWNQ